MCVLAGGWAIPGSPGAKTWRRKGPRYSVGPLFSEAIGNTTDHYKYVNLSDGGHFENLGLYEMVLRRCHFIVVSDGGEDPECAYADLGEAVRKNPNRFWNPDRIRHNDHLSSQRNRHA